MDVLKGIDKTEDVVTVVLLTCITLTVIFLVVTGIGFVLGVRLVWAMTACLVSFGLAFIFCIILALLTFFY